jgi:hypothetical protein
LGEAFGDRRVLLIVDGGCHEQDLRPFFSGGRKATRPITTLSCILPNNAFRQNIDAMSASEAVSCCHWGFPMGQLHTELEALGTSPYGSASRPNSSNWQTASYASV